MTSEQLTPINGQVVGPSNHSATGDTYCKLNAFELPRPGVYAELVLSGESASAPSYVNIPALEMSLRSDAISSMSPASDALSSKTTTYENTVAKILQAYANTISAYENVVISQWKVKIHVKVQGTRDIYILLNEKRKQRNIKTVDLNF